MSPTLARLVIALSDTIQFTVVSVGAVMPIVTIAKSSVSVTTTSLLLAASSKGVESEVVPSLLPSAILDWLRTCCLGDKYVSVLQP